MATSTRYTFSDADKLQAVKLLTHKAQLVDIVQTFNLLQYRSPLLIVDIRSKEEYEKFWLESSIHVPIQDLIDVDDDKLAKCLTNALRDTSNRRAGKLPRPKRQLLFITENSLKDIEIKNDNNDDENKTNNTKDKNTTSVQESVISFIKNVAFVLQSYVTEVAIHNIFIVSIPFETFYNKYPFLCQSKVIEKDNDGKDTSTDAKTDEIKSDSNNNNNSGDSSNTSSTGTGIITTEKKGGFGGHTDYLFRRFLKNKSEAYYTSYPNQIVEDKLFLGDLSHAKNAKVMNDLGITHVVNCTPMANYFEMDEEHGKEITHVDKLNYYQVSLDDNENANIKAHFDNAIKFIETALNDDGKKDKATGQEAKEKEKEKEKEKKQEKVNRVLIHCAAGISRSATITIAYLMKSRNMKYDDAFNFVRSRRDVIYPNQGFVNALKQFEKELE